MRKHERKIARRPAITMAAAALACFLTVTPALSASAGTWWPLKTTNCGSQYVMLHFTIASGPVYVGYGATPYQASEGQYATLSAGQRTIHTGVKYAYWQKWSSPGEVSKWWTSCVSYT